jgi:3-methyl-2-oxobutanoate hydroxymethyltransferase
VRAIISSGIPYCGHLGMLPQHVKEEGGYHVKGRTEAQRERLLEDARALSEAGAFAIVLEIITPPVAGEITQSIPVPSIGIGSGAHCDGQILVTHDLIGLFPWFRPKFVKLKLQSAELIRSAVGAWKAEISAR